MINGEYKNLKIFKQRNARKVEKTSPIEDKNREKTVTLVTGFEEESESESVTEESYMTTSIMPGILSAPRKNKTRILN